MQEQYREINDQIHVSEELFQRTWEAVRKEERRRKIKRLWVSVGAAACICLASLAVWGYTGRDQIHIQTVEFQQNEMSAGIFLGKADEDTNSGDERIRTQVFESEKDVPEELLSLEPSRIDRQEIYIGRGEDGTWHACFEKGGEFWYVTGENQTGQQEFTDYLKKLLDRL